MPITQVAPNLRDGCVIVVSSTGQKNIRPTIIVKITHGHGTIKYSWEGRVQISENAIPCIPPDLGNVNGVGTGSGQQEIRSTIMIETSPGQRAMRNPGHT